MARCIVQYKPNHVAFGEAVPAFSKDVVAALLSGAMANYQH